MNLPYLVPRVIRHFLPAGLTRFLLTRSLVIRPGLETADPGAAVDRYLAVLRTRGRQLAGERVLVFGYGGRFDIGLRFLDAGAGQVLLSDRFAPPDDVHNRGLLPQYQEYLQVMGERVVPRSDRLQVDQSDVRELQSPGTVLSVDLVVSTSVYEHLAAVEDATQALAALTRVSGLHVHFVDLRDHFFKYPFEMLHYSEATWRRWLNPTSNHNRYRLWDYQRVFQAHFDKVDIEILERDEAAFERAAARVRPEFKRGNLKDDSVTLIRVVAEKPRRKAS